VKNFIRDFVNKPPATDMICVIQGESGLGKSAMVRYLYNALQKKPKTQSVVLKELKPIFLKITCLESQSFYLVFQIIFMNVFAAEVKNFPSPNDFKKWPRDFASA